MGLIQSIGLTLSISTSTIGDLLAEVSVTKPLLDQGVRPLTAFLPSLKWHIASL